MLALHCFCYEECCTGVLLQNEGQLNKSCKLTCVCVCVLKHEAIQSFPSEEFYKSNLSTARTEQVQPSSLALWPGGPYNPIMFINVVGVEKSLTVTTAEGSEQSKSNDREASLAVSCFHSNI